MGLFSLTTITILGIALVSADVSHLKTGSVDKLNLNLLPPFAKSAINNDVPSPATNSANSVPSFGNNFGFSTTQQTPTSLTSNLNGFTGFKLSKPAQGQQPAGFAQTNTQQYGNSLKLADSLLPPLEKIQPAVEAPKPASPVVNKIPELATKILPPAENKDSVPVFTSRFGQESLDKIPDKKNLFKTKFIDGPVPEIQQTGLRLGVRPTAVPIRTIATYKPTLPPTSAPIRHHNPVPLTASQTAKKPFNIFESYKKLFNPETQNNGQGQAGFKPFTSQVSQVSSPNRGPTLETKVLPPFQTVQKEETLRVETPKPEQPSGQVFLNRFNPDLPSSLPSFGQAQSNPNQFQNRFGFEQTTISPPVAKPAPASFQPNYDNVFQFQFQKSPFEQSSDPSTITSVSFTKHTHNETHTFETTKTKDQFQTTVTNRTTYEQVDVDKNENTTTITYPNEPQQTADKRIFGIPPQPPTQVSFASQFGNENPVKVLNLQNQKFFNGDYNYQFHLDNGIRAQEQGQLKANQANLHREVVEGSYSYTAPDGQTISVSYVADEQGFKPNGDHIPTPPPIPDAISRAIAYIKAQAEKSRARQ